MSDTFRFSPSGPSVDAAGGGAVESVFGRIGDVVAELGDYDTDLIDNDSTVDGATCSDALDTLAGSDGRDNDSSVPGATVSDALDYLDANIVGPPRGSLAETFSGGQTTTITAPQNTGNIGDNGWNVTQLVASTWSVSRLPPESGVVGAWRLNSPTASTAGGGGPYLVFGTLDASQDDGPLVWQDVGEVYWRARFNPTPTGAPGSGTATASLALFGLDVAAATVQIAIACNVESLVPPSGPNFFAVSFVNPGAFVSTDTGVPVDSDWHDFKIRRVDASTIEFEIDGVVVATHSGGASIPTGAANVTFVVAATSPNSPAPARTTFVDVDTFDFTPAA